MKKIGYKIRDSILKKANYLVILGEKEKVEETISIRKRGEISTTNLKISKFKEILEKDLNL